MTDENSNNHAGNRREFLTKLLKTGGGLGAAIVAGTSFPLSANADDDKYPYILVVDDSGYVTYYNAEGCNCQCRCTCRKICGCVCRCEGSGMTTAARKNYVGYDVAIHAPDPNFSGAYNSAGLAAKTEAISISDTYSVHGVNDSFYMWP